MDLIFTEMTLAYFSLVLLSATICVFGIYDLSRGPLSPLKCAFASFGFSILLFAACSLNITFFYQKWSYIFNILYLLPLFAVSVCTTWIAYHFPRKLEVSVMEIRLLFLTAITVGCYVVYHCVNLLRSSFLEDHAHWPSTWHYSAPGILFVWTLILLLRQATYQFPEAKKRPFVLRFLMPQHQQLQAARNLCLICVVVPFLVFLPLDGVITAYCSLSVLAVFVILYLNGAPGKTSLQVKLVGVFLSLILLLFNFCGVLILRNDRQTAFKSLSYSGKGGALMIPENKTLSITSTNNNEEYVLTAGPKKWLNDIGSVYNPRSGNFVLPFKFPYFGEEYQNVYTHINGYISFQHDVRAGAFDLHYGHHPLILPALIDCGEYAPKEGEGLFTNISNERAVFTWIDIPSRRNKELQHSFQLVLHSNGNFQFNYGEMQSRSIIYNDLFNLTDVQLYGFVSGDNSHAPPRLHHLQRTFFRPSLRVTNKGLVHDQGLMIRQAGFPIANIFTLSLCIAYLIVLIGIPMLFHQSLIRPLRSLMVGVSRVNEGDLDVTVPVLHSDEIGYLTSSFNRMTAFVHRSTKELESHRKLLESTVSERTRTLEAAIVQANEANKAKSVFLANMSHELRTPLHPIIGFSKLVAEGGNLTKGQQESLRIIETSGYHLLSMIENILQLGKVDAGKRDEVIQTEFEVRLLFSELQGMLSMHDSRGNVPIHWNIPDDVPKRLTGDVGKIRQILLNIVGNSVKYTQNGLISVDCECKPSVDQKNENQHPRARTLQLTITDTGAGISESDMEHLFTPFFQAGENARTQKGAGLGLSICKHYIDLLGGEINIQSKLGLGTKIGLTLPVLSSFDSGQLALEESSEAEPSIEGNFSPAEARILIVEDDPVNAKLIRAMLAPHGYNLKIVNNGLLGVKTAQQWRPHLIWMDIRMPVMDGKEAASRIRSLSLAESWAVRPVIIALTADAHQSASGLGKTSVFDHLMIKPVSKEDLIAALNFLLI